MISGIKNWLFDNAIKSHPNYINKKDFVGINPCKSVLLVSSDINDDTIFATENYKNTLLEKCDFVDTLYYYSHSTETDNGYSIKEINWKNVPINQHIDHVFSKEYDLLIYLLPTIELHQEYIIQLCHAKLKIGPVTSKKTSLFDLLIENPSNHIDTLIHNIGKSLKLISSK
ncbi:MAG: hypothetical protein V3V14_04945 [Saprospiraceae bacterium]